MSQFDDMVVEAQTLSPPAVAAHAGHPIAQRMAGTCALARCRITLGQARGTTRPKITITPSVAGHPTGDALLAAIDDAVETRFGGGWNGNLRDALGLGEAGAYVTKLILDGVGADEVAAQFQTTSEAIKKTQAAIATAVCGHIAAVVLRDLGLSVMGDSVGDVKLWALCRHLDNDAARTETINRRMQALDAYGAVASVLAEPAITALIDKGRPLAPALAARLGIDRARLARINGAVTAKAALNEWQDRLKIVDQLALHDVALHRWDVELVNEQWRNHRGVLEPAFMMSSGQRDALDAFGRDVVKPLVTARIEAAGMGALQEARLFADNMALDKEIPLAARIAWLKALAAAIVGGRSAKSYQEATDRWHRRVASIAALRLEHTAPTPGWPALCAPWTSKDGRATLTPLTTARELVEEGTAMNHCVGGYYEQCRSGRTHILSLTIDGKRHATLEIMVEASDRSVSIRKGQFEGYHRAKPDKEAWRYLDEFQEALQTNHHKVDRQLHAAFAKERREAGYEYDRGDKLPPEYIRRAWPLHRPMLTRNAPESYDDWEAGTPLVAAIDAALEAIRIHKTEGKAS